jgi:AcrR family transcriptional regulator
MRIETTATEPTTSRPRSQVQTLRLLLQEASAMLSNGGVPSIAEVAQRAGVSRATAYRYFPSRSKLISAVVADTLGPDLVPVSSGPDGKRRIEELFAKTFLRLSQYEPQFRAALQLSLEDCAREREGTLRDEPYRRGHRRRILAEAASPLRRSLGKRHFDRLIRALSVVYGIEALIVLRDIWGASDGEIEATARWMAGALIDAALRDACASSNGDDQASSG